MDEPVEEPMEEEPMEGGPVVEVSAELVEEPKEPEPIPQDQNDSLIWSSRLDVVDDETVGPPLRNEIGSIGSLTAKLSDISSCIEKEMEYRKSEGKCKDFIHRFLRLIRSPVMTTLTILNFLFYLTAIVMLIIIIILVMVDLSRKAELKMLENQKADSACSVIWGEWGNCSAPCTDRHKDNYKLPTATRVVEKCYGSCGRNDGTCMNKSLKGYVDMVYCNLHSCQLPKE
uniref:Uncharacterized protein n=1 Tax=Meloidogyne javanica TaxID=6303 RepID=A0A915N0E1_MELJA